MPSTSSLNQLQCSWRAPARLGFFLNHHRRGWYHGPVVKQIRQSGVGALFILSLSSLFTQDMIPFFLSSRSHGALVNALSLVPIPTLDYLRPQNVYNRLLCRTTLPSWSQLLDKCVSYHCIRPTRDDVIDTKARVLTFYSLYWDWFS